MRARSRPGIAIAAMMPMIATTISSSMRVNPSCFCSLFTTTYFLEVARPRRAGHRSLGAQNVLLENRDVAAGHQRVGHRRRLLGILIQGAGVVGAERARAGR